MILLFISISDVIIRMMKNMLVNVMMGINKLHAYSKALLELTL